MPSLSARIAIRFIQMPIFVGLLLLLPAGTWYYWQAYLYLLAVMVPAVVAIGYFLRQDPALLERRLRTRETESTQKVVMAGMLVLLIAGYLVPGLDRRFGWSQVPLPVVLLANLLVVRILNEEKVLREQLHGYREYCRDVRWRLLPLVW